MKRILIFITILFCGTFLYAVEENITAVLNLSGENADRYEIGFSSSPIDSLADERQEVDAKLEIAPGSSIATNDSIYFYWKLMTESTLYMRIKIDSPMKRTDGVNDGSFVDWKVSWTRENSDTVQISDGSVTSKTGDGDKERLIYTYQKGRDAAHSIKLNVETYSVAGKPATDYSGTLTVSIGVN